MKNQPKGFKNVAAIIVLVMTIVTACPTNAANAVLGLLSGRNKAQKVPQPRDFLLADLYYLQLNPI
jgi:hypothetical protein